SIGGVFLNHPQEGPNMKTTTLTQQIILLILISTVTYFAIEAGQSDDFQDGTTQNWTSGAVNPNPPTVIMNGGPSGSGDAYLNIIANGSAGAGGRLVVFNQSQWTGDYLTAGVSTISMHLNNTSAQSLSMRIVLRGAGGNFWSADPVVLAAQSGWQVVQFSLESTDLT